MKKLELGDRVVASAQYGYAPIHGVLVEIWKNQYNVEMAKIDYSTSYCKYPLYHIVPLKSVVKDQ